MTPPGVSDLNKNESSGDQSNEHAGEEALGNLNGVGGGKTRDDDAAACQGARRAADLPCHAGMEPQ